MPKCPSLLAGLCLLLICTALPVQAAQWRGNSIRGAMPDLQFTLTNEDGATIHAKNLRGHIALVYFGYTHCPDICPLTLARLHQVIQQLGDAGRGLRVLFVSVDPQRDTPKALKQYTAQFDPQIIGATGDKKQLDAFAKRYRVAYRHGSKDDQGNYRVYHSAGIFVFDRQGHARLLMNAKTTGIPAIHHDLQQLIEQLNGS